MTAIVVDVDITPVTNLLLNAITEIEVVGILEDTRMNHPLTMKKIIYVINQSVTN